MLGYSCFTETLISRHYEFISTQAIISQLDSYTNHAPTYSPYFVGANRHSMWQLECANEPLWYNIEVFETLTTLLRFMGQRVLLCKM